MRLDNGLEDANTIRADHPRTVYAVIPVFNRLQRTLRCIECLEAQSYRPLTIIVADGRSTDGTPEKVRQAHPAVVVLPSNVELWWGGATQKGIEWALNRSTNDDDFVMMVNNDTWFAPDYVEILVRESRAHNVAIGGIVVDENDPGHIIDAGVRFRWEDYSFTGRKLGPVDPSVSTGPTDVLPGRGTLVPIRAVRRAGNVDATAFPHYLADYEFTYRLKQRGGVGLAVSLNAIVRTERPIPKPKPVRHPVVESWVSLREKLSRSSKSNILAHWRFISLHAPAEHKNRLRKRVVLATLRLIARPVLHPAWQLMRRAKWFVRAGLHLAKVIVTRGPGKAYRIVFAPYLIHDDDLVLFGLDRERLERDGIIRSAPFHGYWIPGRTYPYVQEHYPEAVPLYQHASGLWRKFERYRETRRMEKEQHLQAG